MCVADWLQPLMDLLYPAEAWCPSCHRRGGSGRRGRLCDACFVRIPRICGPICDRCGLPLSALRGERAPVQETPSIQAAVCRGCSNEQHVRQVLATARAWAIYDGPVREYIHRIKYQGARDLAAAMGTCMGLFATSESALRGCDMVLPVPLHPEREAIRGYNQAQLLASGVAEVIRRPLQPELLIRAKGTGSQERRNRAQRLRSIKGAFVSPYPGYLAGKYVLLVDDVYTTGATMESAALALLQAGARRVSGLCLARVL